mmetsp:Transcript_128750/g.411703  ORF Transcript_128750/g.411703 Transcript_128750/m.411703 type:complete len:248 (-) Transcript_128750:13-756(-)
MSDGYRRWRSHATDRSRLTSRRILSRSAWQTLPWVHGDHVLGGVVQDLQAHEGREALHAPVVRVGPLVHAGGGRRQWYREEAQPLGPRRRGARGRRRRAGLGAGTRGDVHGVEALLWEWPCFGRRGRHLLLRSRRRRCRRDDAGVCGGPLQGCLRRRRWRRWQGGLARLSRAGPGRAHEDGAAAGGRAHCFAKVGTRASHRTAMTPRRPLGRALSRGHAVRGADDSCRGAARNAGRLCTRRTPSAQA